MVFIQGLPVQTCIIAVCLFVCFVPSLSSCHEKATVALYFG